MQREKHWKNYRLVIKPIYMTYVVDENCIKCKLMDCVEVCPVDCFYEGENMLVIHPDECIDCGACEPECPWQAIFEEVAVPDVFEEDTPLNYAMVEDGETVEGFVVSPHEKPDDNPAAEDIQANKEKWGWDG